MQNINKLMETFPLSKLIQIENFIGWTYSIDYDIALVITNDLWKSRALGVPHNCFLVGASFNPENFASVALEDQEVILFRVLGAAKLPQDEDLIRTKIDHLQGQDNVFQSRDLDDITQNQLQFGGLECRILGTFFYDDGKLWLGSDIESFATASRLNIYRPHGDALRLIANYVDPIRLENMRETALQLGVKGNVAPFQIGTIRYTSTDRLHRRHEKAELVPVYIQPADFLARRTAVLGMTRTGKSNMIKQLISVVKRVADDADIRIGQIIYDINGEYANANQQDKGSIADIYGKDTVRYRLVTTSGFEELKTNFFEQINEGFGIIQRQLEEEKRVTTDYVRAFVNMSLDEPDKREHSEHSRWEVRLAAYKVLLFVAGFDPPQNHRVKFTASQAITSRVKVQNDGTKEAIKLDPQKGLSLSEAHQWFLALRQANQSSDPLKSTTGKDWVDDTLQTLLDMIAQKRAENSFISGHRILASSIQYHTSKRTKEVTEEIYNHLLQGKIIILDLSVGNAEIRDKISIQIASKIFQKSMQTFIDGYTPPNIVIYIEEAHNLIGKGSNLTETWPRLAKEGAKYRLALVYATQEVSAMHPNILANTENWFITHLNNTKEIREISQFYDFDDFGRSLVRAQDVGFARVKTLSSPFVIPVQIERFDPDTERVRAEESKRKKEGRLF